jgi:uncharacterized protein (UPF0333 family)
MPWLENNMKLPLPSLSKKTQPEYYLALILRNERATSVLFSKAGNTIKYLGHGEEDFGNTIEDATTEQFLEVLDKSITQAETVLPDNIETRKTIFGLKESWIEDNKIKKEYLEKLKKASEELGLDPIGFLVSSESIVNLLQKDEGAPVTAILVEMGQKFITVSFVKSGKILETKSSEIHQSAPFTVDTLLKHFQAPDVMPARIVIYGDDEEEVTQEFIGHPWSKSLPFLHLPQITSFPKDASIKAMLLGAATQMGAQLLYDSQTVDFDQNETPTKITPEEITNFEPVKMPVEEEVKEQEPEVTEKTKAEKTEPKGNLDYVDKDQSLEYFGFVESGDVAKKTPPPPVNIATEKVPDATIKEEITEIPEEEKIEEEKKNGLVENVLMMIPKAKLFASKIMNSLLKASGSKQKMLLLIIAVVIVLIAAVLFIFTLNTKATVTILVNPKTDQKTAAVTFSPNAATDISSDTIASQPLSVSEDGSMTTNATGTKDVGAAAKGSVTIFNIGTGELDLGSGTQITSPNNLVFTLDSAVTVASGDAILGASTGTANVTASDIGQDYNLPSGTKFTVSGQDSSVAAKNDNAFSGGSKKTVTVVSADDVQKLLTSLPKQLEGKAKTDIGPKVTGDNVLLNNFVSENVDESSDSFDHKAGDQANSVTLKGTVNFQALTYNSNDMLKLAQSLFGSNDTQVSQSNLSVTANNIGLNKDNSVSADLQISAGLVPKLDSVSTAKQIAGLSITKARNLLSNIPQVQNVGIALNPNLPFLSQNLPGNPNDITIQITAK